MDSSEPSSSGMSGTVPNKKRKSGEEKLTASERSKLWRQQQKERDPEGFREREQSRTRERRLRKKKNQTTNLSNRLTNMSNKEDLIHEENDMDCNELLSSHSDKPVGNSPSDEQAQMNHQYDEGQIAYLPNTKNAGIQYTPFLDTCIRSSRFGENSDLVEMSPFPIHSDNLDIDTDSFSEILQLVAPKETPGICHDSIQECKPNEQDTLSCSEFPPPVTIVGSSIENNTTNDNPTIEDANLKPFDQEMESSSQFPSVPDTRTATDFCPEVAAQGKIPSIPVLFGKSSINRSNACQNMMLTGDCNQPAIPSSDKTVMNSGSVAQESPLLPPGSVTSLILDMEQDFSKPVDNDDDDSSPQIACINDTRRPIQVTTGDTNHVEESNTGPKAPYKEIGIFKFISINRPKGGKKIDKLLTSENKIFIGMLDDKIIEEVSQKGKTVSSIKFSNFGMKEFVKDVTKSQRNGAIWFACENNSVNKYLDGKCTEMFRTSYCPVFLYVDSSNSKEKLFVCHKKGLEIWDDEGKEGKCIDLYKPLSGPNGKKEMFYPDTVDKDAVSGKVLVISKVSVPILLDKSLEEEPTFINTLPVICPEFRLYCGCFNHAGDIIVGTSSGVYVLSGVNYEVLTTLGPRYGMEPILCLPNYDLWVGCYDEIYRYSYQNKKKQLTQASTSGSHL